MSDCEYCALTEPEACCAEDSGWVCTRPPGHSGEHVACHTDRHQLHTWQHATAWPDEADKASKRQVGGDHYARLVIQPAKYNHANNIPFIEGCVIKYVTRWRDKGGKTDLLKARHFIDLLLEFESDE